MALSLNNCVDFVTSVPQSHKLIQGLTPPIFLWHPLRPIFYVSGRVTEIIDSFAENWFSIALFVGLLWAFCRVRQLEARVEQLSPQQTNLTDFKASVDSELTAVKADISWL
jgi:hypothetical protein